jgi:Protein of unknown function (DUF2934)
MTKKEPRSPARRASRSATPSRPRPASAAGPAAAPARGGNGTGPAHRADAVAVRAYELYLARGGAHGHDVQDWLQAERELSERPSRVR